MVAAGRQEIFDCWADSFEGSGNQDALLDALFGSLQLGFNGESRSIISAYVRARLFQFPVAYSFGVWQQYDSIHTSLGTKTEIERGVGRLPHSYREIFC